MELKELNPELFSYELYNSTGYWQIGTALNCAESFGYCDASRLLVRPKSGDYAFLYCDSLKDVVFKGKTLEEVKQMENYSFGIEDESIIKCV